MIEGHDMLAKMSARKSSTLGAYFSAVVSMHSVCRQQLASLKSLRTRCRQDSGEQPPQTQLRKLGICKH